MTDNLRTKNIWYEARQYNPTQTQITATQDENLIYPLLTDAQNYNVGVSKAVIPLNSIPLRQTNLPLKYYQVGLRQGDFTGSAYIRQINSNSNNYMWQLNGLTITKYQYTSTGITSIGDIDISGFMNYAFEFQVDDYQNLYIAGSQTNSQNPDSVYIISLGQTLLQTITLNNITSIYINGIQNLYIADEAFDGAYVNVYSNQNGENSVNLTLLGTLRTSFGDNPLQNIAFVCATIANILVGHDDNIVSFYNNELQAVADFTIDEFNNMTAGNVLNGDDCFVVANASSLKDALYASAKSDPYQIFNVETDSEVADGSIKSKVAISTTGTTYGIGSDNITYYSQYNTFGNPPATWTNLNSTIMDNVICANQSQIVGITQTGGLAQLNLDLSTNNNWITASNTFKISPSIAIIDMDYNITDNKIIAVGQDYNLYKSANPVYPLMFGFLNTTANQLQIMQASPVQAQLTSTITNANIISNTTLTTPYSCSISNEGYYYFLEQEYGVDPVVRKRDPTGFAFTELSSYSLGHANLIQVAIVGNYMCVADNITNQVYIYTLDTTTLLDNFNVGGSVACLCSVDNDHILAVGFYQVDGGTGFIVSNVRIYNLNTFTAISTHTITNASATNMQIQSICANQNDISNGTCAVFVSYDYTSSLLNNTQTVKLTYVSGYTSASQTIINDLPGGVSGSVSCISNAGLVAVYNSYNGQTSCSVFSQSSGYSSQYGFSPFVPSNQTVMFCCPTIDLTTTWDALNTGSVASLSVSVSRTTPNQLYTIEQTSSTVYTGYLLSNTVNLTQLAAYATQNNYAYISSWPSTKIPSNATLNSYTISSQDFLGTVNFTNQKITSIAKNELDLVSSGVGEFLIPTNNNTKVGSYSPALTLNYSLNQATSGIIYAKNGENIDAGAVPIYSYSVLINAINIAFQEAYLRLKVNNPSPLSEAPSIALDYNTKLCTLTYSADYTSSLSNGIYFNNPLMQLISFTPNIPSSVVALPNMFQIVLPLNSTSYTQTSGTIYQFNQLLRIGIQSNTIYVSDSYFGNNQTNRIISTIDVPTDQLLENNTTLYYQPTFMRPYQLASTNAINRIQVDILYLYKDFTSYPLLLNPDSCWSVQFAFIKK